MSPPRIAIIGAGPAGLLLARLLQRNLIPCTVYEKEKDRHARTQGGSLDIHEGSAQLALKEAGLYDEFLKVAYPDGEVLKIYTPEGKVLLDENEKFGVGRPEEMKNQPEIDGVKLRDKLLDSLDSKTIQWGRKLLRVEETGDKRYNLHFECMTETGLDVVVGADGAWSKVRSLLSDTKPSYAGVTGLDVTIVDADSRSPAEAKRVGGGMCLTIGKDRGILAQRNGNGTIRTYAFVRCPEFWHKECGIDWTLPETAKHAMIDTHYADWDQGAKDMILKSDDDIVIRPMYMLPIGFKWEHRTGATCIGDAAHLMCPFAGVGFNVGMLDALQCARAIIRRKSEWDNLAVFSEKEALAAAIGDYEEEMFARSAKDAAKTIEYQNVFFNPVGAEHMVEYFGNIKAKEESSSAGIKVKAQAPTEIKSAAEIHVNALA